LGSWYPKISKSVVNSPSGVETHNDN